MNLNILFYVSLIEIKNKKKNIKCLTNYDIDLPHFNKNTFLPKNSKPISIKFLKKTITSFKILKFLKSKKKINFFFVLNKFLIGFIETFFKKKVLFNFKKGTNKLILKQISYRKFTYKYFKKNLKISKQIIGILYYSFLLKDSSIFVNFFKKILENLNLKLHKKVLLGLRKLIKDFFVPIFKYLNVLGVFFNIKGKIGVSGSAKKKRYFFYFGKHSITTKYIKVDLKHTAIWTLTGTLGFTFSVFF